MAQVTFELPDDIYEHAQAAALPIEAICRAAVDRAVAASGSGPNERDRYADGFDLGRRWAVERATTEEIAEIAMWASERWASIRLDPSRNSLPAFCAVERGRPAPNPGAEYWLEHSPFSAGLVDGVASVGP